MSGIYSMTLYTIDGTFARVQLTLGAGGSAFTVSLADVESSQLSSRFKPNDPVYRQGTRCGDGLDYFGARCLSAAQGPFTNTESDVRAVRRKKSLDVPWGDLR